MSSTLFDKVHSYYNKSYEDKLLPDNSVINILEKVASIHGEKDFITEVQNGHTKGTITYKELYRTVNQVAKELTTNYKIKKQEKIGILPINSINSITSILAVMLCGGVAVIINPNEPQKRVQDQLNTAECRYVITQLSLQYELSQQVISTEQLIKDSSVHSAQENIRFFPSIYDPAVIMYTTGTTSKSKPIVQTHYNIAVNCTALKKHHFLDQDTRLLCTLPIYYANGLEFTIFSTMISGSHVVVCDKFDPFTYLKTIEKMRVNIASLVPSGLAVLAESRLSADLSTLKYFVSAAAPLPVQVAREIFDNFGKRIIQGYGLTETTNFSTLLPTSLSDEQYRHWMLDCKIPTVGCEVFGNEVGILNKDGEVLSVGEEGEICMRGHNVMAEYFNNELATADTFRDGWFHSGDLGQLVLDEKTKQKFCIITGRLKNIIKIGGQALSLDEVDRLVQGIEGVSEVVSCSIEDEYLGETYGCVIVKDKEESININERIIMDTLKAHLSEGKLPKQIIFVDEIPRSMNGKVNRKIISAKFFN